jgi:myo-inositol-1(or 4)-monophosphatase
MCQDACERTDDLTTWLELAQAIAKETGELLAEGRATEAKLIGVDGREVKVSADRRSEERIIGRLQEKSDFDILSEESGTVPGCSGDPEWRWIVDPLDGSANYLLGVPFSCVSVGLWRKDEPILGTVYDFNRRELFGGIVGMGAWLNGVPIRVGPAREPQDAVLCTGFPVGTDFSSGALTSFVSQVRSYRKIRMLGSAALSLAYVAAGRADAYFERDIRTWDVAAGLAIVLAAGGWMIRSASERPETLTLYAGPRTSTSLCP